MRKNSHEPDVDFDQEHLTEQALADKVHEIANTAAGLSIDFRQLLFWRRLRTGEIGDGI